MRVNQGLASAEDKRLLANQLPFQREVLTPTEASARDATILTRDFCWVAMGVAPRSLRVAILLALVSPSARPAPKAAIGMSAIGLRDLNS